VSNAETVQAISKAFGRGDIATILDKLDDAVEWETTVPARWAVASSRGEHREVLRIPGTTPDPNEEAAERAPNISMRKPNGRRIPRLRRLEDQGQLSCNMPWRSPWSASPLRSRRQWAAKS
jgi:hypothetical protein